MSTAEFIQAAHTGFEYADEYEGGEPLDAIVNTMEADPINYSLIAEIAQNNVELHLDKMGIAGTILFNVVND